MYSYMHSTVQLRGLNLFYWNMVSNRLLQQPIPTFTLVACCLLCGVELRRLFGLLAGLLCGEELRRLFGLLAGLLCGVELRRRFGLHV